MSRNEVVRNLNAKFDEMFKATKPFSPMRQLVTDAQSDFLDLAAVTSDIPEIRASVAASP